MAITSAEILTAVNRKLNRSETDIDTQIKEILYDISSRGNFLKSSSTITAADSTASTSAPDLMKEPIALYITGGNYLDEITYDEYMQFIEDQSSVSESEPEQYALLDDTFYWKNRPDTDYTVNIDYYKYHADSTTVEFDDRFRWAIYDGVAMAVARDLKLTDQFQIQGVSYEAKIASLLANIKEQPKITKYRDV